MVSWKQYWEDWWQMGENRERKGWCSSVNPINDSMGWIQAGKHRDNKQPRGQCPCTASKQADRHTHTHILSTTSWLLRTYYVTFSKTIRSTCSMGECEHENVQKCEKMFWVSLFFSPIQFWQETGAWGLRKIRCYLVRSERMSSFTIWHGVCTDA